MHSEVYRLKSLYLSNFGYVSEESLVPSPSTTRSLLSVGRRSSRRRTKTLGRRLHNSPSPRRLMISPLGNIVTRLVNRLVTLKDKY